VIGGNVRFIGIHSFFLRDFDCDKVNKKYGTNAISLTFFQFLNEMDEFLYKFQINFVEFGKKKPQMCI
jgi:hypothetical protein